MKSYLAYLLVITASISMTTPSSVVAKPKQSNTVKETPINRIISPAVALERLIVAEKLDANWFTPEFLKAVDKNSDVNALQLQRDITMKIGRFRYGKYKSVQSIGGGKYRIIFERAEPDDVIVKLAIDNSGRIAGVDISEKNKPAPTAQAQASAQAALDKSFKTNTRANGENSPILTSLKQWLGNYQKVQKIDATDYVGIFERGSAPVTINFKPDGSIENYRMGCPTTKLSRQQAPAALQKILANCPNLK
ncbi:hypothetical protein [Chamaesiphon sp. GL140_3_metabinner_50]|uniref:hypothetical protein n=1 Tax=Chamaesiphon sp. GL140_3_metabinner_50 TaxID=2970812 RepID=UPI0025FDEDB8|nr:hypothetical protein [Chamaesiphon sp. GL140_3_metabinner_50]